MRLSTHGAALRDEHDRHRILHGINLVAKGHPGATDPAAFRGAWQHEDLEYLATLGLDSVRLGLNWAATEPSPGEYSTAHLDWICAQLDACERAGLTVVLDAHQDLYSQQFGDGAPAWATLTSHPFEATELWSDAYLTSPAVHEAYDAFWADAPGPEGVGIRSRFAAMWGAVLDRCAGHPALIGCDVLNEPTPGSAAPQILGALMLAIADVLDEDPATIAADLEDPERKFARLQDIEDPPVHRAIGDRVASLLTPFETGPAHALYTQVAKQIRARDEQLLILREHSYFSNIGVPAAIPLLEDATWAYSPHGYDLVVDTPAMPLASDARISTIFDRAAETAERLAVPVIVGEWGAFEQHTGIARHARHQLDLFDRRSWSWFYWCWSEGFAGSEAAQMLDRPRAIAVAGTDLIAAGTPDGSWEARWQGTDGTAPSEFRVRPELTVTLQVDGDQVSVDRRGDRVLIDPREGAHHLRVS